MTHKRVVAVVISIWVLSVFISLMSVWVPPNVRSLFTCIIIVVGLVLTTLVYIRIYLAARRHKNQIQALQVQQVAEFGEIKSAAGTFYVFLVFLV